MHREVSSNSNGESQPRRLQVHELDELVNEKDNFFHALRREGLTRDHIRFLFNNPEKVRDIIRLIDNWRVEELKKEAKKWKGIPPLETRSGALVQAQEVRLMLAKIEAETGKRTAAEAARLLDCPRTTLCRYCDKHGIERQRRS